MPEKTTRVLFPLIQTIYNMLRFAQNASFSTIIAFTYWILLSKKKRVFSCHNTLYNL